MPENLKKLLRDVFSIDTEAGYCLRYHIMRALACEDYEKEIDFSLNPLANKLSVLFTWKRTSEGSGYWDWVDKMIHLSAT